MKKIGLLWHSFTSDNLGVGALSVSHMALIDRVARNIGLEPQYRVIGTNGTMDYLGCVACNPIEESPFSLRELVNNTATTMKVFNDCSVVFDLGEGDSFADIYGTKRIMIQLIGKLMVLQKGIPLVLSPQTIGPFKSKTARFFAKQVMRRAVRVFPRDGLSKDYLEKEGLMFNSTEVIDLAFGLPFVETEKYSHSNGKCNIGLNVSGLLYNGGYNKNNQFGLTFEYKDFISRLLTIFAESNDLEIHLVSHVISDTIEVEDDYRVAIKIQKIFPFCRIAPRFSSPVEAKSYISGLDFFVGSRMHATIAAFSSGVPVIPVAYSRKFKGLFNSLGYKWVVDATTDSLDISINNIIKGIDRRQELTKLVEEGNKVAAIKLSEYEDFLTNFLRGVYAL